MLDPGPAHACVFLAVIAVAAAGDTLADDGSGPALRPLNSDRPGVTDSPISLDAGHVQLELGLFEHARNGDLDRWSAGPLAVRVGLLEDVDLQFVLTPYAEIDRAAGGSLTGTSDLQLRLKVNLWGNPPAVGAASASGDPPATALALIPAVTLPTGSGELTGDHVQGAFGVTYSGALGDAWALTAMARTDFLYDAVDDGYDVDLVHTLALSRTLGENLGGYAEYIGLASTDGDVPYRVAIGGGFVLQTGPSTALDAGVQLGLEGDLEDVSVFAGVTLRY